MTDQTRVGVGYIQLRRDPRTAKGLRVVTATQSRPSIAQHDCLVVKVRFEIPDSAWENPTVTIVVPSELAYTLVAEAEAETP